MPSGTNPRARAFQAACLSLERQHGTPVRCRPRLPAWTRFRRTRRPEDPARALPMPVKQTRSTNQPPCSFAEHFRQNIAGMHSVQWSGTPKYCKYEFIPANNWRSGPLRQCIPANIWREIWAAQCIPAIFWLFLSVFPHGVHTCNFLAQPGRTVRSVTARARHPGASCSEGAAPLRRAGTRDVTKTTRKRYIEHDELKERPPTHPGERYIAHDVTKATRKRCTEASWSEDAAPCAGRARGVV